MDIRISSSAGESFDLVKKACKGLTDHTYIYVIVQLYVYTLSCILS